MTESTFTPADFPSPMLLFGCGNMTGAMADGWMAAGVSGSAFHVVKPTPNNMPLGATHFASAADAKGQYKALMIGVKPHILGDVAQDIRALLAPDALLISILGGVGSDSLQRHFPSARILRVMPNLAVALGKSPLGLFAPHLNAVEKLSAERWLSPLGYPYWMTQETDMHAFTALAGCAPAYLYRFIDALAQAGMRLGMEDAAALKIAKEMAAGAAQLAAQSNFTPSQLASRVASKGGSTAAGLSVLDNQDAILHLMENTLRAAHDRSVEQSKEAE
jgi:pyrroline-5-carboxylate reductase